MTKKWFVAIVLILAMSFAGWHFFSSSDTTGDSSSSSSGHGGGRHGALTGPMPIVAATAKKGDMIQTLDALGNVTPLATVVITPQISGVLQALPFKEGQMVQAGDVLVQIDPRPYQLAEQQAAGQLERDTALWHDATITLARFKEEIKTKAISEQQLDDQQSLVDQYLGAMHTDQAAIDTAKLNQVYCRITAPVSGRVGLRQVDVGNYIQAGVAAGVVVLTQEQPIDVLYTLPEDNLAAVLKSIKDGAMPETDAFDRSRSTQLATGKLIAVDNKVDPTTGTFKLRSEFENKDESLFPQQFVNVKLLVSVLHDTIIVPSAAVLQGAKGTYVYLIKTGSPDKPGSTGKSDKPEKTDKSDASDKADKPAKSGLVVTARQVTVVQTQGDNSALSAGLAEGDRVVVDGADKLHENSPVTIPDPAAAAPAGKTLSPDGTSAKPDTSGTSAKPDTSGTSAKPDTSGTSAKPDATGAPDDKNVAPDKNAAPDAQVSPDDQSQPHKHKHHHHGADDTTPAPDAPAPAAAPSPAP